MLWSAICSVLVLLLQTSNSLYVPSVVSELEHENAIVEDQYLSCPECYEQRAINLDNTKRVNVMRTWARSGMPLSILYLKTKPNIGQPREEVYGSNFPSVPLPYRANPSTRGFNSKLFQATLIKARSNLGNQQLAKVLPSQQQSIGGGLPPMRRQSVVLPQLFVSYGFDSKKSIME